MAEGRNTAGGVGSAGLRWWQEGSTEKKPAYFTKDASGSFWKAQRPLQQRAGKYYKKQFRLIDDRNTFYQQYNPDTQEPKYTFAEAMRLSPFGYTGIFGRSKSKQTLGLIGEEWQRAYALDRLRKNKQMLAFNIVANTSPTILKDIAAADLITPGTQKYKNLAGLYSKFNDKYGVKGEDYVDRYGHLPEVGTKYGILFNTDLKKVRKDDADVTYQNNLVKASVAVAKDLNKMYKDTGNNAFQALGLKFLAAKDYQIKSARGEYNPERVKEMEARLNDYPAMMQEIAAALGGESQTKYSSIATGILGATVGLLAQGPAGMVPGYQMGASKAGNDKASKALDYMNSIAESDALRGRKTYWTSMEGGLSQFGTIGLTGNFLRGVARFGLGLPAGVALAGDEGYLAGKETVKWAKAEGKYDWGDGVDFKLGDAIWADYAQRYYDPFSKDETGRGRSWWDGIKDPDSWDRFGEKINEDPAAYVLDVLDVAPVVGAAAKSASVVSTAGRTARILGGSGRMGVTAAERAAWKDARQVVSYDEAVDRLNNIRGLEQVFGRAADPKTVEAAEAAVLAAKFDAAPSARTWRKTVRAAYNGDTLAANELSRWRAMGMEFNGLERGIGVRASAFFEPRTKVLEKPESVAEASPMAVYRLPASPIIRGAKEAFFWIGKGVDRAAQGAAEKSGLTGRLAAKFVDMPLLSYRYNYTKAIKNEAVNEWGDINTEMQRAARLLQLDREADLTPTMRRAIESDLFGGTGVTPLQYPAIQRQQIRDKIAALPRDKATGEVVPAARKDLANLELKLSELLDNQIVDIDEAAKAFDDLFDEDLANLRLRIADPTHMAGDPVLDAAVEVHRKLARQDSAVRSRIVHDDTTPTSIKHMENLYREAMDGLGLGMEKLFGRSGTKGRLGRFTGRVLRVNTNMLLRGLVQGADREQILSLAQKPDEVGTVFDDIESPALRKTRENQMIRAFEALSDPEVFVDGLGSYGTPGRPVLIQAKASKNVVLEDVGPDFVQFHIPRLRHTMDNGRVIRGKLVDENEVFVLPKVFFAAKKKGAGPLVLESSAGGRQLLYEGALNAMAGVYPKARYYSEKINDTGARGVRQNEKMIANEHQVAESGLRQHALSRIIQSQVHYMRSRVERDLRGLAESQAVIVPAAEVVGKEARESGYHVLHNIRPFDNADDALDYARLRGVGKQAEEALAAYADGTLAPIESTLDVVEGLGYRIVDGQPQFLVRGGMKDWAYEGAVEDLATNSTLKSWIAREFSDPSEIPDDGLVLAIPNRTYRDLAETVIESDTLATRLLNMQGIKGWGNLFKWFVLNANPGFIANNVIGGMAMMMMYNPLVASRLAATMVQKMARESLAKRLNNDWFTAQLTHFKAESEAVQRQLAYELENNIYRQDAGLMGAIDEPNWAKKYIWHGGYTVVSAWEATMRNSVAMQFLRNDAGFQSFMRGPEVKKYIEDGVDWNGNVRQGDDAITPFEAAVDLLLDRSSPFFNANLKHRMRYMTNTISGNYHNFTGFEQLLRNVVMPFYAWQRHSATFSYRMLVDRPITTNILYNVGQQGYQQNLEQGLPEWMMGTVPVPQVIKDIFDITDDDFRIDGGALTPFGTTGDMGMAAFKLLAGGESPTNVFEFGNPYFNQLIQDTLGVDPVTGRINWERLREDGAKPEGVAGMGKSLFGNIFKATYPYKLAELAKYKEYEEDALANKYAAVENAPDILRNYDPNDPEDPWKLSIPEMRSREEADPTSRAFSALGIKTYNLNPDKLPPSVRQDAVGAIVLKYANEAGKRSDAESAVRSADEWKRKYDYVMQVWLPAAEAQNMDPVQIQLVLTKIMDERPKRGIAKDLTDSMIGG